MLQKKAAVVLVTLGLFALGRALRRQVLLTFQYTYNGIRIATSLWWGPIPKLPGLIPALCFQFQAFPKAWTSACSLFSSLACESWISGEINEIRDSWNHIIFGGLRISQRDMPWLHYHLSRSNWTQHLQPPDARRMSMAAAADAGNWDWLGRWDEFRWGWSTCGTNWPGKEGNWRASLNQRWIWGSRWLPVLVYGRQT